MASHSPQPSGAPRLPELHTGNGHAFRLIHKGDVRAIVRELRKGIRACLDAAGVFANQWRAACRVSLLDMVDLPVPGERAIAEVMAATFAGAIATDVLPVGSGTVAQRVKAGVPELLRAWRDDKAEGSAGEIVLLRLTPEAADDLADRLCEILDGRRAKDSLTRCHDGRTINEGGR